MKLAFSSNAYMQFSIEDTIRKVAELGYSGIEILADVPHAWPAGLLEERKESIRQSLWKYDLKISNVNAFMMNAVGDPRQPYWHPGVGGETFTVQFSLCPQCSPWSLLVLSGSLF